MNLSLAGDIAAVMPMVIASGLLRSLCTITVPPDVFDEGGAPDPSAEYEPLAGHSDIACMKAPIDASETKTLDEILSRNLSRVVLDAYYPDIETRMRAVIDGIEHDIVGVESDSQHQYTRLTVSKVEI
jgi:hypothetical protein